MRDYDEEHRLKRTPKRSTTGEIMRIFSPLYRNMTEEGITAYCREHGITGGMTGSEINEMLEEKRREWYARG